MSFSRMTSSAHPMGLLSTAESPFTNHSELSLLEQTFRMLPDIVSIYDVDSQQVIYSNRSFADVLGYDRDAQTQWLMHPDDVAGVENRLQHLLQARDNQTVEVRYRLKQADGNWKWFSERQLVFKRDDDGSAAQILKTAREVQPEPPSANDLLYRITEYNLPNFAILIYDQEMRFSMASGILLRRLGFSKEKVEGQRLREVVSTEIADWLEPAYQAALSGAEIHLERTIAGLHLGVHCLPIRGENGEIAAGMVLVEDVTDEKQAFEALLESEQRFAQFSENMQSVYWMLDIGSRKPLYFSAAFEKIWGFSPGPVLEHPTLLLEKIYSEDLPLVKQVLSETISTGKHEVKFRIIHPDGTLHWLLSRAFPIYDEANNLYRVAGIIDDITQHMEMEKVKFDLALDQENMRLLSQFIGTTSHELRTPLTIINTSLYLLRKINDPSKQEERLDIIEHQVAQLTRLIGQMHTLLRLESIQDKNGFVPVALNKMLTRLEADYAPGMVNKAVALELVLDDELPNLHVNPDWLLVALQNVLENAINYTDEGSIRLQTSRQDHEVVLTVEDTGVGIDPEDLPHIFERFYKVEKNKKRSVVAAGLGLAITRRIMQLGGGRIEVESQLGQGSTFRLIWPAAS